LREIGTHAVGFRATRLTSRQPHPKAAAPTRPPFRPASFEETAGPYAREKTVIRSPPASAGKHPDGFSCHPKTLVADNLYWATGASFRDPPRLYRSIAADSGGQYGAITKGGDEIAVQDETVWFVCKDVVSSMSGPTYPLTVQHRHRHQHRRRASTRGVAPRADGSRALWAER
jgi:hypothetical protein